VNQTIENGIAQGGIGEAGMPVLHRHLGGHQGRGPAISIVDDFQQVADLGRAERIDLTPKN